MTDCDCKIYAPLELDNTSIYKRIQDSKPLLKQLALLAAHPDGEQKLFRCQVCYQLWQYSRAQLWGNNAYLFKVPDVHTEDWLKSAYLSPDEIVEYNKAIRSYKKDQAFYETGNQCKHDSCTKHAIELSVRCLQHHMQMLQNGGTLPAQPKERVFEPYAYNEEEVLYFTAKAV